MTESSSPYNEADVTSIVIEGLGDWNDIVRGSFKPDILVMRDENGKITREEVYLTATDSLSGDTIFFFADRLKAVRFRTEENPTPSTSTDNRQLP